MTLVGCQADKKMPESETQKPSSFSQSEFRTYTIPELGMTFDYPKNIFQEPVSGGSKVILYAQGEQAAGAGAIRFSFNAKDDIPEYETWHSDYIGNIAAESTLETVCANARWPEDMLVDCKVVSEPVPHAEFYIGNEYINFSMHKSAIFFTKNSTNPGLFVDVLITDVPEEFQQPGSARETKQNLQKISSGEIPSARVAEFDRIIASIRFE